ncbi:MAG: chemotaxis response regulator protein-glutamate methylesterase [Pirellulaceae bacterium]
MVQKTTRVLIVDDSALMRELIQDLLKDQPGIEVVGTAVDGMEAIRQAERLRPDVVTLDVQMPKMDGLETLQRLLEKRPVPVLMLSAATKLGGDTTLEALERGAIDYLAKPEGLRQAEGPLRDELCRKIRSAAGVDVLKIIAMRKARAEKRHQRREDFASKPGLGLVSPSSIEPATNLDQQLIAIGISTGGPPALAGMFESLSASLPPIVIVQHMPPNFTKAFADRLNSLSRVTVKEAETGDVLKSGHAYLAPGGFHLEVRRHGSDGGKLAVFEGPPVSGHRPSVDVMMRSVAKVFGNRVLGVVMTGMGRDGSDGCGAIRAAGGFVLGQDERTSDIYGMNKVAMLEGNVDRQFSLEDAPTMLVAYAKKLPRAVLV